MRILSVMDRTINQLPGFIWRFLLAVVIFCWRLHVTETQPNTIRLELGNARLRQDFQILNNNSVVDIALIGDDATGGDPLVCATQLVPCCADISHRFGHWFYPNGTEVPINGNGYSFYRNRRDNNVAVLGGAFLNRRFGAMGPTGIYHCDMPGLDGIDQTLYVGLYTSANNGISKCYHSMHGNNSFSINGLWRTDSVFMTSSGAWLDSIAFALTSDPAALSVTFSLTCTSNGGPINTMQWEKDGVLVPGSSIYPVLTNANTATYCITLQVTGREPGVYTCIATDGGNFSISLHENFTVEAANPPSAVSATLNMTSGSVLISWEAPESGGSVVTGYRIYYNSGDLSVNVPVARNESHYQLDPNGMVPGNNMNVSIRAESNLLPSEIITVEIDTEVLPATTTTIITTTEVTTTEEPMITDKNTPNTMSSGVMVTTQTTESQMATSATRDDGSVATTEALRITYDRVPFEDDPLLIIAIIEGIIIFILITILIVITLVFLCWRLNRKTGHYNLYIAKNTMAEQGGSAQLQRGGTLMSGNVAYSTAKQAIMVQNPGSTAVDQQRLPKELETSVYVDMDKEDRILRQNYQKIDTPVLRNQQKNAR